MSAVTKEFALDTIAKVERLFSRPDSVVMRYSHFVENNDGMSINLDDESGSRYCLSGAFEVVSLPGKISLEVENEILHGPGRHVYADGGIGVFACLWELCGGNICPHRVPADLENVRMMLLVTLARARKIWERLPDEVSKPAEMWPIIEAEPEHEPEMPKGTPLAVVA